MSEELLVKYNADANFRALVDFFVYHLLQEEGYTSEELSLATALVQDIVTKPAVDTPILQ